MHDFFGESRRMLDFLGKIVVPGEGFEPPTFGLQNRCTTTVLTRHPQPGFFHAETPLVKLLSVDSVILSCRRGHEARWRRKMGGVIREAVAV